MESVPDVGPPLERFIEALGEACLVVAPDGRIVAANEVARKLYGATDQWLLSHSVAELCSVIERDLVQAQVEQLCETPCTFTSWQRRENGGAFFGALTGMRAGDEDLAMILVRRREADLRSCTHDLQFHKAVLEHAMDGIIAHTLDGELLYANEAAENQWGFSAEEASSRGQFGWVVPAMRETIAERVARLEEQGSAKFESRVREHEDGGFQVEVNARVVSGPGDPFVVATVRDISERIQTEEMVRYLAYHDGLTGLANRVSLQQELFHCISIAERHGDLLGVAYMDLDDFKPINDTYGHTFGDDVLREVANNISACVREGDTVARVGGDEFVVVLPRLTDLDSLATIAEKLRRAVSEPILLRGKEVRVSASIGTALYQPGDDVESLLNRADIGMYASRRIFDRAEPPGVE